jgi:uncharacterized membrane protein YfcA
MSGEGGEALWLALVFLVVALVYASVGQAGASGYIAAMGLLGMAPLAMKTTALALNLLVAGIGTFQFWRTGLLSWRAVYPFALLGFPFSLLGGAIQLPTRVYYPLVGVVLLLSAAQMVRSARRKAGDGPAPALRPPFVPALLTGAAIGLVSGTTGTGGGVFLAPVILAMNWASVRQTAATTAVYNLMNSGAALAGAYAAWDHVPPAMPLWLGAVGLGGAIGAFFGSRHLPETWMRYVLALLLFASGLRLVTS